MTDIVERLREFAPQMGHYGAHGAGVMMDQAAAEIERLRAELATLRAATASVQADQRAENDRLRAERDASNKAAAWCDRHKPSGGARGHCVICSGEALSAALSRISYLCGEPNEMGCGPYDVHCDEDAVVEQVRRLVAERDALRADAGRYRWLRAKGDGPHQTAALICTLSVSPAQMDAAIDAAMASSPTAKANDLSK